MKLVSYSTFFGNKKHSQINNYQSRGNPFIDLGELVKK